MLDAITSKRKSTRPADLDWRRRWPAAPGHEGNAGADGDRGKGLRRRRRPLSVLENDQRAQGSRGALGLVEGASLRQRLCCWSSTTVATTDMAIVKPSSAEDPRFTIVLTGSMFAG
jgi:hypothetical protein